MLFNSPVFLFFFLPIILLVNRLLPTKWSNLFLLVVSLAFYTYGEGKWISLLLGSILWNYASGIALEKVKSPSKKGVLITSLLGNIVFLIYFKYALFIGNTLGLSEESTSILANIVLPLGISFFTFQGISYVVDVYRTTVKAEFNFIRIALYIAYFPQLIAGPIIKYKEINQYFSNRKASHEDITQGILRFIRGLAKKVILADNFALIADDIFAQAPLELSTPVAWLGVLAYTLQIYYDFSAYSDMAIALGRIMGFKIPENFNYPYISSSIREFWRRWHISLSSWFRDYLYISLGGNRKSTYRTYLNLSIVFFITGLWHGAAWHFVAWGLVHGLFLVLERIFFSKKSRLPKGIGNVYALTVVALSWVVFRSPDLASALAYYKQLFTFSNTGYNEVLLYMNPYFITLFLVGILFSMPFRPFLNSILSNNKLGPSLVVRGTIIMGSLILFIYSISEVVSSNHHPFIYFKF